ncbi:hypothetical protein E2C01_095518 [Portunus trituberculatus]|uniref:Uncharacterized protein n=1 Tax=Portunus trituberculatus TaxID=210409 RepID=A0A5B7JZ26_PORTR|nr:hypothetical protein [Portunus trituberculatus]
MFTTTKITRNPHHLNKSNHRQTITITTTTTTTITTGAITTGRPDYLPLHTQRAQYVSFITVPLRWMALEVILATTTTATPSRGTPAAPTRNHLGIQELP